MGEQSEAQNAAWKIWRIESAEQCIFDARHYRAPNTKPMAGFGQPWAWVKGKFSRV